jgi:hypothetical protein
MRNTRNVKGDKLITGVGSVNLLVAFYNIQERERCLIFFFPAHHTGLMAPFTIYE